MWWLFFHVVNPIKREQNQKRNTPSLSNSKKHLPCRHLGGGCSAWLHKRRCEMPLAQMGKTLLSRCLPGDPHHPPSYRLRKCWRGLHCGYVRTGLLSACFGWKINMWTSGESECRVIWHWCRFSSVCRANGIWLRSNRDLCGGRQNGNRRHNVDRSVP
jgi:hypothetical protein